MLVRHLKDGKELATTPFVEFVDQFSNVTYSTQFLLFGYYISQQGIKIFSRKDYYDELEKANIYIKHVANNISVNVGRLLKWNYFLQEGPEDYSITDEGIIAVEQMKRDNGLPSKFDRIYNNIPKFNEFIKDYKIESRSKLLLIFGFYFLKYFSEHFSKKDYYRILKECSMYSRAISRAIGHHFDALINKNLIEDTNGGEFVLTDEGIQMVQELYFAESDRGDFDDSFYDADDLDISDDDSDDVYNESDLELQDNDLDEDTDIEESYTEEDSIETDSNELFSNINNDIDDAITDIPKKEDSVKKSDISDLNDSGVSTEKKEVTKQPIQKNNYSSLNKIKKSSRKPRSVKGKDVKAMTPKEVNELKKIFTAVYSKYKNII